MTSKTIYQKILEEYRLKQDRIDQIKRAKEKELLEKIPLLQQIEKEEMAYTLKVARKLALGKEQAYEDQLEDFRLAKKNLLLSHGYEENYLDPVYECEKCKDTGFIGSETCSCFNQRLIKEAYKMSNLDKILAKENFQSFDFNVFSDQVSPGQDLSPRENMKEIMDGARKFIRNFEDPEEYNLLFYGTTGLGKTFMTNCIAKEILDLGYTVIYQTAHRLMDLIGEYKFGKTEDLVEAKKKYDYLLEADLLIIDDLGTEVPNAFSTAEVFNLINTRKLGQKKMIISTNLSPGDISKIYTDRVYSRILDSFDIYEFIGQDLRWKGY
ncbi:MAG: ATP-binding protein [Bacillota bacterium]|nr:ATP-binding protein [Bacillota bacterium]